MSVSHTLARNTFLLTAASIGQKLISFVYFTLIANFFGDGDTGAYFLALALVTTIGVVDDLGLRQLLTREVATNPGDAKRWLRSVLGYKLFTIPVTAVLAFVLPPLLGFNGETAALVHVAIAIMVADTLSVTFFAVLRGLQQLKYESIGIFFGQVLASAVGITLIATGEATLMRLIIALMVGSIWNAFFAGYHVVRRLGWEALRPSLAMGWAPIKVTFAFFLADVFVKIYGYLDSFVLNVQMGEDAVGIYSAAYKLTYAFQFLPLVFVGALYPSMSAASNDHAALRKIFLAAEWYMALLAAPIIFGLVALAPEFIALIFNPEFAPAAVTLPLLAISLLFIFFDFPVGSLLNATKRQGIKMWIMGGTMVVNAVVNFVLIPQIGIPGAGVAAIVSFAFMFIAGWIAAAPVVGLRVGEFVGTVWRFFAAGAIMAGVVMAVKPHVHVLLATAIGAVVYVALIFASKAITPNHLRALHRVVRGKVYDQDSPANA